MAAKAKAGPEPLPRGRHSVPAELVSSYQRLRLIDASAAVLAERGYARSTTTEIAKRARVSTATLYQHHSDLWECLAAAYAAAAAQLQAEVSEGCVEASGKWPERLRAALDRGLDFLDREPAFAYLLSVEPPSEAIALRAARRELIERLAALLRQGRGGAVDGARHTGRDERLIEAVFSLAAAHVMGEEAEGLPEMGSELAEVLLWSGNDSPDH